MSMPQDQTIKIDLHLHSTVSDGSLTPRELIERAKKANMRIVALTDHDAVGGIGEAQECGKLHGVMVIPGIEITLRPDFGRMHLLGYCLDDHHPELLETLHTLRQQRITRMSRMLEKLQAMGLKVRGEVVDRLAQGGTVGRVHLARAMVACGDVFTVDEAFNRYIGDGKPGYCQSPQLTPVEGVGLIRRAGGHAVLAHPWLCGYDDEELDRRIARMKHYGMSGLECYGPGTPLQERSKYCKLAKKYDLIITGGSDFHGAVKPNIEIGLGLSGWDGYAAVKQLLANRLS